jgi:hypothetical protein
MHHRHSNQTQRLSSFLLLGGRIIVAVLALAAAGSGCVKMPTSRPKAQVKSFQPKTEEIRSITPTDLQSDVMRFADEYSMVIAQAAEDFATRLGTFEARQAAVRIKLGQATAAVVNAAGQNSVINALDLVVLSTMSRMVAEDYLVKERFGAGAEPLAETSRRLETNAWSLVQNVLKPEQREELREMIRVWRLNNPNQRFVGIVRFREFAEAIGQSPKQGSFKPTSVFGLLFLDPMSGLDPTLRAVEETRYLAERALYYGQRMPILLSWQAEFLALQLADQPAARQVLTNADQLTASLEVFAKTAEELPRIINQQSEATIKQFFAGIAVERSNILATLAFEEKTTRGLLTEARGTLDSANAAIQSLESFVRYVTPPKTNAGTEIVKTNSRPFNVLDYGTAAGQIGGMAREINTLLTAVNQAMPPTAQLGQRAAANIESAMWHGFRLGAILILILLAGAVVAGLSYRILVSKFVRPARGPSIREP